MIVGILNVTPDSFSDGGEYNQLAAAMLRAAELISQGAEILDIGGDSTRPGSSCVGPLEEWMRIGPIIEAVSKLITVSVDTHHAAVAKKAIEAGASIVNDIWAARDPEMLPLIAHTGAKIILMYSTIKAPHLFEYNEPSGDLISNIRKFFEERISTALAQGVTREQLILDPGMGAFLSSDPKRSWELIERFSELGDLGFPLMLGCSRKGFLKQPGERSAQERDAASVEISCRVKAALNGRCELFVRTHNVALQKQPTAS